MKRNYVYAFNFALVWVIVLIGFVSAFSQKSIRSFATFAEEVRPFDFSDKFYYENGVEPAHIVDRRNGSDNHSVFDTISDPRFRSIRLRGTFAAYNQDGKIVFWNHYGEVFKDRFRFDETGQRALDNAQFYPLYIFPSTSGKAEFRQAHLIHLRDGYFEKNPLGLGIQVMVEFTDRIDTKEGREVLARLARNNGISGDGTPIIKTVLEIEELTQKNLVTQKIKGLDNPAEPSYAIARVIGDPQRGAIAPDAFLMNDLGLKDEQHFVEQFGCLQSKGKWCGR